MYNVSFHCYSLHFSVNNVAGHGIPDARELQEGDILNIDVTVFLDGFHGDCSATIPVGQVDDHALKLIQVGWSGQSEIRDQAAVLDHVLTISCLSLFCIKNLCRHYYY